MVHPHHHQENALPREQRLCQEDPGSSGESRFENTTKEILGDLHEAESRGQMDTKALAAEVTGKLIGWESLPQKKQQEILENMVATFSRNPEIVQDAEKLTAMTDALQKNLAALGYAKESKSLDGKGSRFEELHESSRVSRLLEDRTDVIARGVRSDGTTMKMCRRMEIWPGSAGSEAQVVLTNGEAYPLSEFMKRLQDSSYGFHAVDMDFMQRRIRDYQSSLRQQNRYSLQWREQQLKNHIRAIHRSTERRGRMGTSSALNTDQQKALTELQPELTHIQQQMKFNQAQVQALRQELNVLRDAKWTRIAQNPTERDALKQRAAQHARRYLTQGQGYHILRDEGLEVKPGTPDTAARRPKETRGMIEEQYAENYKHRTREELNRIAAKQLRESPIQLKGLVSVIKAALKQWEGDKRIVYHTGTNEISVGDGRVIFRMRPEFYDPETGKTIGMKRDFIALDEIPANGAAIRNRLALEVIDGTVEADHWRHKLATIDQAKALTRMHVILDEGNPSTDVTKEYVAHMNERNFEDIEEEEDKPETVRRIPRPVPSLTLPYERLTKDVAAELTQFHGEQIIFEHLKEVEGEAILALLSRWNGAEKKLWLPNLPIHERSDVAKALRGFKGKLYFGKLDTGTGEIIPDTQEYRGSHRTAIKELSYLWNPEEENIFGLDESMYRAMEEFKARRGEMEYHGGTTEEGLPAPTSPKEKLLRKKKE